MRPEPLLRLGVVRVVAGGDQHRVACHAAGGGSGTCHGDRLATVCGVAHLVDKEVCKVFPADPFRWTAVACRVSGCGTIVEHSRANDGPIQRTPANDRFLRLMVGKDVAEQGSEQDASQPRNLLPTLAAAGRGDNDEALNLVLNHGVDDVLGACRQRRLVFQVGGSDANDDRVVAGYGFGDVTQVQDVALEGPQFGLSFGEPVHRTAESCDLMPVMQCLSPSVHTRFPGRSKDDNAHVTTHFPPDQRLSTVGPSDQSSR